MKNKKAFTLFELLVSISIIAILTAIASISYGAAQKKARDSRRIEDMNGIQKAAEMYYGQNSYTYPKNTAAFINAGVLQQWPIDPKGIGYTQYTYNVATTYCSCAAMENPSGNSLNITCNFSGVGGTGAYYCVKSQQ